VETLYNDVLDSLSETFKRLFENKQYTELNSLCECFRKLGHLDDICNLYVQGIGGNIMMYGIINRLPNCSELEEEKVRFNIIKLHESLISILREELKYPTGNIYKLRTNHNFLSHKIMNYIINQHVCIVISTNHKLK
jgi:hypothetical protein